MRHACLVTSQNVTAPKLVISRLRAAFCLVTSQNVTAPKPRTFTSSITLGLVTSQNVTAPKLLLVNALICIV